MVTPNRALEQAFFHLFKEKPFYANALIQMDKMYSETIVPIAGFSIINSRPTLIINPKTFPLFTIRSRAGIVEHEIGHAITDYFERGEGLNPGLWNAAADFAVNSLIDYGDLPNEKELTNVMYEAYKHLIEPTKSKESFKSKLLIPELFDLPRGESAEWYYKRILSDTNLKNKLERKSGGDGENPFDENMEYHDAHKAWDLTDNVSKEFIKEIVKDWIKNAVNETGWGNVQGDMKQYIEKIITSRVNWKRELRQFVAKVIRMNKRYTWKRLSKRVPDSKGTLRERMLNLIVAFDTSGSITDDELSLFCGEIERIYKAGACNITLIECDTKINSIKKYKPGEKVYVHGRGGTSLIPPFEWAAKKRGEYDAIIYFTDTGGPAPEKQTIPTLWVITASGWHNKDDFCSWGRKIKLEAIA